MICRDLIFTNSRYTSARRTGIQRWTFGQDRPLMNSTLRILVFVCLLTSAQAFAAGDAKRGEVRGETCLGCHGVVSYTNVYPTYRVPKLGGQHAEYISAALKGYRSGERSHPTMNAQASGLSDQDIEDISAYFASIAK